MYVGDT